MEELLSEIFISLILTYPLVVFYLHNRGKDAPWRNGLIIVAAFVVSSLLGNLGPIGAILGIGLLLAVITTILETGLSNAFIFLILLTVIQAVIIFGFVLYTTII